MARLVLCNVRQFGYKFDWLYFLRAFCSLSIALLFAALLVGKRKKYITYYINNKQSQNYTQHKYNLKKKKKKVVYSASQSYYKPTVYVLCLRIKLQNFLETSIDDREGVNII